MNIYIYTCLSKKGLTRILKFSGGMRLLKVLEGIVVCKFTKTQSFRSDKRMLQPWGVWDDVFFIRSIPEP